MYKPHPEKQVEDIGKENEASETGDQPVDTTSKPSSTSMFGLRLKETKELGLKLLRAVEESQKVNQVKTEELSVAEDKIKSLEEELRGIRERYAKLEDLVINIMDGMKKLVDYEKRVKEFQMKYQEVNMNSAERCLELV